MLEVLGRGLANGTITFHVCGRTGERWIGRFSKGDRAKVNVVWDTPYQDGTMITTAGSG